MDAIMEIKKIPVTEINPAPYNPRKDLQPGDSEYEQLQKSIEEFGYVEPLVWNKRSGTLISGHQRLKVLKAQGVKEVEVSVVDLSAEKEKVLNIALNKIKGRWDEKKLSGILFELTKMPDFDVGLTGFEAPEISELFDKYSLVKGDDDFDFDAALAAIKEPVTRKGDLIQLGPHRILCGDSSNPEDVKTLMGEYKAELLNTDFPYNVDYYGGNRPHANGRPKQSRQWERIYSDNMQQDEYEAWMHKVLRNIKGYLKQGAAVYIWQGHRQIPPMYQILIELGFHISSIICWLKESAAISYGDYSFRTEHALYGWLEGAAHYFAGKPGEGNVWEVRRDATSTYIHPTQKPVELAQRAIRNSSQRNSIVLDTFLGSGSTLIACASLGRRCFGLELDAKFIDALVFRYIAYVGKDKVSRDIVKRYLKED